MNKPKEKTAKTYIFLWQGINKSGNTVKGEINTTTIIIAKAELRRQGIILKKIKQLACFIL